jgi:thioredoxin reductase
MIGNDDGASASQTFDARRLLLDTGLRDVKPDLPGFSEFYGLSVFHCSDCDGYEVSDKRVAVLGAGREWRFSERQLEDLGQNLEAAKKEFGKKTRAKAASSR